MSNQKSFNYTAKVTKIIDGDTFYAVVDLGFSIAAEVKFTLSGIDTPEIWRSTNEKELEHGRKAKDFLSNLIMNKYIYIESSKTSERGKWLAKVLIDDKDVVDLLIENGFDKKDSY